MNEILEIAKDKNIWYKHYYIIITILQLNKTTGVLSHIKYSNNICGLKVVYFLSGQ